MILSCHDSVSLGCGWPRCENPRLRAASTLPRGTNVATAVAVEPAGEPDLDTHGPRVKDSRRMYQVPASIMNRFSTGNRDRFFWALTLALIMGFPGQPQAQPFIISTVPDDSATGVSPSAPVVFTFSDPMGTNQTTAQFHDSSTFITYPTTHAWSTDNTVLTCTPAPAFPANRGILWSVSGQDPDGSPLAGSVEGLFRTGSSGGAAGPLILANPTRAANTFSFDVTSSTGQTFTVEYSASLLSNSWNALLTTNSPGGRVHVTDPWSPTNLYLYYRARNGS